MDRGTHGSWGQVFSWSSGHLIMGHMVSCLIGHMVPESHGLQSQICINILSRYRTSYSRRIISYVATDKPPPPKMAASSGLFLATIYNQSQLAERKHVACYWLIDTAATAVPLSLHPSTITKLAAAIPVLGGRLFGGSVLPAQYCPCGCSSVVYF